LRLSAFATWRLKYKLFFSTYLTLTNKRRNDNRVLLHGKEIFSKKSIIILSAFFIWFSLRVIYPRQIRQGFHNHSFIIVLILKGIVNLHLELPKRQEAIKVVELGELHAYVGQKKLQMGMDCCFDRYGKRFVSFVCGRSTQTGLKLWDKLKELPVNCFCSDYRKSYAEFIPQEKHIQTKAETYTVESYNSRIRHYSARFKRKTECYTKADYMIEVSLNLLMLKLNNELTILN